MLIYFHKGWLMFLCSILVVLEWISMGIEFYVIYHGVFNWWTRLLWFSAGTISGSLFVIFVALLISNKAVHSQERLDKEHCENDYYEV